MFEDLEPRPARGAPLIALTREDLDGYSVEDLKQRIAGLQAEIERVAPSRGRRDVQFPVLSLSDPVWHGRCTPRKRRAMTCRS